MKAKLVKFLTCLALCLSGSLSIASIAPGVTPDQAQAIAREAYIYANPVADCYRIMYTYFVDTNNPEYKGHGIKSGTLPASIPPMTRRYRRQTLTHPIAGWYNPGNHRDAKNPAISIYIENVYLTVCKNST
jgi:hypothetical protein